MQPDKGFSSWELSPELRQAQARLLQLRIERGIVPRNKDELAFEAAPVAEPCNWELRNARLALQQLRLQHGIAITDKAKITRTNDWRIDQGEPYVDQMVKAPATVTIHSSIALAILRQHAEAPARVYFLLRVIDKGGRGWLSVENIRRELTRNDSPLRICGWRRLRQLLREGEGVFWQRDDNDRLWLKGAHRIAYTLDSGRLQGFPVELPISALLGGIQAVRAAFYATFHGGRDSKPISRETLESLSGIPGRTQLEYDRVARVERRRNIAIGERHTNENAQERAWRHGRAAFHFIDTEGRQGRAGREYVAWHLPNSYQTAYQRRSRGSRKRLNRKLADLVKKGIPGNDGRAIEKLFFPNGALAARQYNRDPERDAYWRQENPTRARGGLWHVIAGIES